MTSGTTVGRPRWRKRAIVVCCLLVGAVLFYNFRASVLPLVGHWLDVSEPPRPVDCVLLLPGDYNSRPFVAAALFKAGLAREILVPSVRVNANVADGLRTPEDVVVRAVLTARGIPTSAVTFIAGESDSTADDAQLLFQHLDRHHIQRLAIVTNDYHTRRAAWTFRQLLGERKLEFQMVGAPMEDFGPDNWWLSQHGILAYGNELAKLAYYFVRLGPGAWYLAGLCVVLLAVTALRSRRRTTSIA